MTIRSLPILWILLIVPLARAAEKPGQQRPAPSLEDVFERQGIEHLKNYPAWAIEEGLPDLRFEDWIEGILGLGLHWAINDCGEGGDGRVGGPVCVEVSRGSEKQPDTVLDFVVGNDDKGIIDPPQLFFGSVKTSNKDVWIKHLSELHPQDDFKTPARVVPGSIAPPPWMLKCVKDEDCVVVSNSCNGCCQQAAININYQQPFQNLVKEGCKGYRGGVCDCVAAEVSPSCKHGSCVAQPAEHKK